MPQTHTARSHGAAPPRWTRTRMLVFLHGLVECGTVSAAAQRVGMSRKSAYALRKRVHPGFAEAWDESLALGDRFRARGLAVPPCPWGEVEPDGDRVTG